jgi:hypothetical protein
VKHKWIWFILLLIGLSYSGRWVHDRYQADIAELKLELMRNQALQLRNEWRHWKAVLAAHRTPFEEWREIIRPPGDEWFLHQTVDGDFFCGTFGEDRRPGTEDDQVFYWQQLTAKETEE